MNSATRAIGAICIAALLAVLGGCAAVRPAEVSWADPEVDLVWPEPPDKPRIRFLRSLTGPADFRKEDQAGKLFRWLTGEKERGLPLLLPYGVAADGQGRVWVADTGSRVVHAFDLARLRVDYLAAVGQEPFIAPVGVAFDGSAGRLYVSDSLLKKVFVLDEKGNLLDMRLPAEGYGRPAGLATGPQGNLYVVDVLKGKVEVFSRDGEHLRSLGSLINPGGAFSRPSNVFVDDAGRVFVTDAMNFRVEILGPEGDSLGTIGEIGDVPGTFARPRGVAVDSEGHIYVADAAFDNIQVFDLAGRLLLYFGGVGQEIGQFSLPAGLFFDENDRLYVVDTFNKRIQVFQYLSQKQAGGD